MRNTSPFRRRSLIAVAAAGTVLLAACGSTGSTAAPGPATTPPPTANGHAGSSGSMDGMNMAESSPANGLLASDGGFTLHPLTAEVAASRSSRYQFQITEDDGKVLTAYKVEQTKMLHFYLIRSDLTGFQHLHPTLAADGTWSVEVRPPTAGAYRVFTQFAAASPSTAAKVVLSTPLTVRGASSPLEPLPPATTSTSADGYTLSVLGSPKAGVAGPLTIDVTKNGAPVKDLQSYLGTYVHLTAFHEGDLGFAHLHPIDAANSGLGGPTLHFDAELAEKGRYRLFIQFQADGALRTAQMTLTVR